MPYLDYVPAATLLVAGSVAWGNMSARVRLLASDLENKLARDLDKKASREIVDAHYQEIIARLDRIERNQNGRHAEDA